MPYPFKTFTDKLLPQSVLRSAITAQYCCPETESVPVLLEKTQLTDEQMQSIHKMALDVAGNLRNRKSAKGRDGLIQGLLQEFSLSSQEGVALMCLAEALLRIPDKATRDALIKDKMSQGNWKAHLGQSSSIFINVSAWGLLLTGKLTAVSDENSLKTALYRALNKGSQPLIRKAMNTAMQIMGSQFVTGKTIDKALMHAKTYETKGFSYSYDMLGEAVLTKEEAEDYHQAYVKAIEAIGREAKGKGKAIYEGPEISLKLSALHPRCSRAQHERVMSELYPKLLDLTLRAKHNNVGINIDAEEADRLDLSLDLLEKLCHEPALSGWNGIGFVIQAYQKRCLYVIDYVVDLAKRSQRRLMVRLVKGAYWDSEIKRAQVDGLDNYPVYTRKYYTDLAYLACAQKLLSEPEAIYPQFATHNAHTLSAIYHMAGDNYYPGQYEFQCLHGMGERLYEQIVNKSRGYNRPCRIYAPVGTYETLLAYLVRRLLENGANTSFVNRVADPAISLEALIEDPIKTIQKQQQDEEILGLPHPKIPLPHALYGHWRRNSKGINLANESVLDSLGNDLLQSAAEKWEALPLLTESLTLNEAIDIINPAEHNDVVGKVHEATAEHIESALYNAQITAPNWQKYLPVEKANILETIADKYEEKMQILIGLLVREAGKTYSNAIAEVREAVDFLRYYAGHIKYNFSLDSHKPLGTVVCISPWNFPLAIFTGQIAAALAAGNVVIAKPAEQTPLIAAAAVSMMFDAGIPKGVMQLLPGQGETVGAALVADSRVDGVMFTGSTVVAQQINRTLATRVKEQGKIIPLIAETGGQNAMIVDSSALIEQVVVDIMVSAFDSAGQRCSALRLLCIQDDVAERALTMLKGAMDEYYLGNPQSLAVDVGPVIDAEAKARIEQHIQVMRDKGHKIYQSAIYETKEIDNGTFVLPTLIELEDISELQEEVFGPVLHVVRYVSKDLEHLLTKISELGYGLTMGIHTRIDEKVAYIVAKAPVGNIYVNRNIVGAVVGVQPFGGEGLSGTGPKAGGPLYLYRLLANYPKESIVKSLCYGDITGIPVDEARKQQIIKTVREFKRWATEHNHQDLARVSEHYLTLSQAGTTRVLPGPTGERNTYILSARKHILCLAESEQDSFIQLAAALAVGAQVLWTDDKASQRAKLPQSIQSHIKLISDWQNAKTENINVVLFHGDNERLMDITETIAKREGEVVAVYGFTIGDTDIPLERLLIEQAVSVNTTAAGGNTSLMTMSDN